MDAPLRARFTDNVLCEPCPYNCFLHGAEAAVPDYSAPLAQNPALAAKFDPAMVHVIRGQHAARAHLWPHQFVFP